VWDRQCLSGRAGLPVHCNDQPGPIHFRSNLLDFVEHHSSDALPPKISRYNNVVDLDRIGCDLDGHDRNQLADELPEQAACRDLRGVALGLEKAADRIAIG